MRKHNFGVFRRMAEAYQGNMKIYEALYKAQGSKCGQAYFDYLQAKIKYHEYMILSYGHEKVHSNALAEQCVNLIQYQQEKLKQTQEALSKQKALYAVMECQAAYSLSQAHKSSKQFKLGQTKRTSC